MDLNLPLFISTFALIFVAELPDKTALAALILATGNHSGAVFIGVALAFLAQSLVAVSFGSLFGLLPPHVIQIASGVLFLIFAVTLWRKRPGDEDENRDVEKKRRGSFKKVLWSSFSVIFIAEWGDLTQIATAALVAKHRAPLTIFISATLALWSVTALAVVAGNRLKKYINPFVAQRVAAMIFFIIGWVIILKS